MIDLIIPYYNNPEGLARTLASIDTEIFHVLIVDDYSDEPIDIQKPFHYCRKEQNEGPGMARQEGLFLTGNSHIMFLDTGDVFTSPEAQLGIVATIAAYPDANLISFPYFYKGTITKKTDNRMHGKVYKREFLNKYGITFAAESSYLNEDIGFNRTCRICTEADAQDIIYSQFPVIEWIEQENSLTQREDNVVLYRDQTRALSLNAIHTIEICRNNDINYEAELNQIAISLYYWFVRTAAERPTYMQDAWTGARIFYKQFEKEIEPNKLLLGNPRLKQCLQYRDKISFPINILRFASDIQQYEIIPDKYLTFSEN